ncbi:hypothetical protein CMO84_11765 [Candidatus Woesearchaeota archaeon]|jgi:hypothetical protein|nr:hypothetical protein [Candidatus Woesearchaeota archaeon]MDP6738793.1 hypothetical protein [Planctomycetota bacterium]MDP6939946.1 hypothetical protein [Planctomycetota bacterium]
MHRRLLLGLISLLGAMVLAEGATRLWLKVEGQPYERASAERTIRSTLDAVSGLTAGAMTETGAAGKRNGPEYELQPYSGYVHRTVAVRTANIVESFRSQKKDEYVVVSQGGSMAAGFQGKGLGILLKSLEDSGATGGREVRAFGLSVPGYKQPQQLTQLVYLLSQGCHPDLVLNLDGLNELRISSGNLGSGLEPSFPSRGHWGSLLAAQEIDGAELDGLLRVHQAQQRVLEMGNRILERGDCASALTGTLAISRMARSQDEWARTQAELIDSRTQRLKSEGAVGYKARPGGRDAVLEAVACWKRSSLTMHQLCEARGIRYVHVLQPTLHDEGSKVMTEEERRVGIGEEGLHPAVVRGYPLLREALSELREAGVEALDACDTFKEVSETIYVDSCHVTQEGNRILANNIARMMGLPEPSGNDSAPPKDK